MATLGERIRHYREGLGLTLEALSEKSTVDVGTISALENRKSRRSQFAPQIAQALGLTVEQLLDETRDFLKDPPYPPAPAVKPPTAEQNTVVGRLTNRETDIILAWRAISQRQRDHFYKAIMDAHEEANQFAAEVLARRGAHGVVSDKRAAQALPERPDGEQPDSVPGAFS